EPSDNPTSAYVLPLLVLVATALVTGAFAVDIDRLYAARAIGAVIVLYLYRQYYRELRWSRSYLCVAVGAMVAAAWLWFAPRSSQPASAPSFGEGYAWALPIWVIFRVLGSAVVVPICEELGFRGYLLRRLVKRYFTNVAWTAWTPFAVIASSLAFGL